MPVNQRGNSWQASVAKDGKRWRKTFATRADALAWEATAKASLARGNEPSEGGGKAGTGEPLTIERLFELVFEARWRGMAFEKTAENNGKMVVNTIGASTLVSKITTSTIDSAVQEWTRQGNAGSTINRKLAALSTMLRWAEKRGFLDKVPHIDRRKESESRLRWFTEDEEANMLAFFTNVAGQVVMHDLVAVALDTGMRQGELLNLTPADLATEGWVRLSGTKTKSKKARDIPMTRRVAAILARRCEGLKPSERVFKLTKGQVNHYWKKMREHLDLGDDGVFHVCRHTFCSRLVQRGVPILEVQKLAGHETLAITQRYAKLAPKNLAAAITVLEAPAPRLSAVS